MSDIKMGYTELVRLLSREIYAGVTFSFAFASAFAAQRKLHVTIAHWTRECRSWLIIPPHTILARLDIGPANLRFMWAHGTSFEGANLQGACLQSSDLRRTNLRGTNLRGANLRYADLRDTNFEGANLEGSDLTGAVTGKERQRILDGVADGAVDLVGGTALVGGDDIGQTRNAAYGFFKLEKAVAAGIGFIALHNAGPLVAAHGAGAAVGQQVYQNIIGMNTERVVFGFSQDLFSFFFCSEIDRFHRFYPEGFNDCFHPQCFNQQVADDGKMRLLTGDRKPVNLVCG